MNCTIFSRKSFVQPLFNEYRGEQFFNLKTNLRENLVKHALSHPGLGKRSFQKNATFLRSFAFFSKERNILAFFYILYKRMLRSLRSFTFFIKECGVLCVLLRSL